jgi:hypothetical protein
MSDEVDDLFGKDADEGEWLGYSASKAKVSAS